LCTSKFISNNFSAVKVFLIPLKKKLLNGLTKMLQLLKAPFWRLVCLPSTSQMNYCTPSIWQLTPIWILTSQHLLPFVKHMKPSDQRPVCEQNSSMKAIERLQGRKKNLPFADGYSSVSTKFCEKTRHKKSIWVQTVRQCGLHLHQVAIVLWKLLCL